MTWKIIEGGIIAPEGFYGTAVKAGIKYQHKYDLAVVVSEVPAAAAGMFTRNVVKAHPLVLTEKHLAAGIAQAVVVNSGNANACMGETGDHAAMQMATVTAHELGIPVEHVVVSSTGVIGQELPLDKVIPGIRQAVQTAEDVRKSMCTETQNDHAERAALAIMTTDTAMKTLAMEMPAGSGTVKLGIMAKGSGMIHPNMGTMLCFITTDAKVEPAVLKKILQDAVDESFNMITVDGDTSTNDMVVIMANAMSEVEFSDDELSAFASMVKASCIEMAKAIARDGEGASKFITVNVTGAGTLADARLIARSVCSSNLVKSAIYGEDANWGRILAAAGYSGAAFTPAKADIYLNGLQVASQGRGLSFCEDEAAALLQNNEITITINLADGAQAATGWGCDLTHKYIDINADYRT